MAEIIVSYARVDKARAPPLVAALEGHGWSVWWDSDIAGGQEFDALITRELDGARGGGGLDPGLGGFAQRASDSAPPGRGLRCGAN